jgi:type I restriction enzyme S subunit
MIEGLQPYSEYKESELPWLGRCPSHWALRRTKVLFHERVQKGFPKEPLLAATQTKGVVRKEDYETRTVTAQKDLHLLKLVETGDYVISLRSFQGGIEYAHQRGIISPAYTILKPGKSAKSGFYTHFFKAKPFVNSLSLFVTGIREGQNVDYERLSRAEMPLPPEDEQAAIVRFLNHANGKIDGFIRAKRKLIGLLNEQKQAIIHRAVTRGLNPNAPLKPSGIPWLGDIPEHWEVRPIKQLLARMDYGISESSTPDGKIRVLTMGHIQNGRVLIPESGGVNQIPAGLALERNDLLFNRTNSPELVGKVGIFTEVQEGPITFASYLVRLRVRAEHSPHWLNYLLGSFRFWAFARSQALVSLHQANLNSSRYGRMVVPLPSRDEQDAIVAQIETEAGAIESAIARTEREIALMQEYRTRLTADVVTGKLDVRTAAAKLPDLPTDNLEPEERMEENELEEVET